MKTHDLEAGPHCHYPPRVADEVDVTEQVEADATRYVVRNRATSRYFLLKQVEYSVFRRIDGTRLAAGIASGEPGGASPRVSVEAVTKFLAKLDSLGLLARGGSGEDSAPAKRERGLYIKIHLFNPDRLLGWLDRKLSWALTRPFIVSSFVLILFVTFSLLIRFDEVSAYSSYTYAAYGLSIILLFTLTITALHEFAHGLACKHFGGDVRELGVLMIFYVLPAFYCNVTDIYRLGHRRERLWVISAGIYWQLIVSAAGALIWLVATPYTALADFTFLVFIGGTLNILVNCNPLIKLDGYYALSQLLGVQNLQSYSSGYVRSLFGRLLGKTGAKSLGPDRPLLYVSYWMCSLLYSITLMWVILTWAGNWLIDNLGFFGILLTLTLACLLSEKWWKPALAPTGRALASALIIVSNSFKSTLGAARGAFDPGKIVHEGATNMSAQQPAQEVKKAESQQENSTPATRPRWVPSRRRIVKGAFLLVVIAALVAPWEASTGSDCTLLLPPGHEEVARANTDAVLSEIYVQPGDAVAGGAKIARLVNPEIEDRLTQINAEISRLNTNATRIEDDLRVRSEMLLSANFKETERKRLANELKGESLQILRAGERSAAAPDSLPASLAVLQSEIELKQTEFEHNQREVERYKKLFEQGLVGSQQYDRAVASMKATEKELQGARARLKAAMVEHRRQAAGAETDSLVAETEARAARSSFESLIAELHANRQQLESLRQRRDILQREYEGMNVTTPRAGVVLGEDLCKMIGRRYGRGEEILRIGELEKFLLKIDVSEREIANVRLDSPVRFKLKTIPGRTFTGRVSKISAEPAPNQYGQRFYPVDVLVENSDGILRPGMTGFARISFGRQSIGLILAEKLWQALRPEMWLF